MDVADAGDVLRISGSPRRRQPLSLSRIKWPSCPPPRWSHKPPSPAPGTSSIVSLPSSAAGSPLIGWLSRNKWSRLGIGLSCPPRETQGEWWWWCGGGGGQWGISIYSRIRSDFVRGLVTQKVSSRFRAN